MHSSQSEVCVGRLGRVPWEAFGLSRVVLGRSRHELSRRQGRWDKALRSGKVGSQAQKERATGSWRIGR